MALANPLMTPHLAAAKIFAVALLCAGQVSRSLARLTDYVFLTYYLEFVHYCHSRGPGNC